MTTSGLEPLDLRIERAHRTALVRTVVLSVAVVVAAAAFLWFITNQAERANARLHDLNAQIETAKMAAATADARVAAANAQANQAAQRVAAAEAARAKAEAELKTAQDARAKAEAELKTAQEQLAAAVDQTAKLRQQISELEAKLKSAFDLQKHVYKLNWDELKMIAADNAGAAGLLERLMQKNKTPWDMSNTDARGYNSPGFATLILRQMNLLPAGRAIADLPRREGAPHPGDVVLYDGGFALFYFRDHQRREFVIGMTPSGVLALNYDFGVRRGAVLNTGLSPR
jgi:hypothetical protein